MLHDEATPKEARVTPVHSGHKLLSIGSYQKVIREISDITRLDVAHEKTCYLDLIEQFAEFVQLLPQPLIGQTETMLERSVKRSYIMLREFAKHQKERHGAEYLVQDVGARLLYAVFSAALLFEIGNICIDRRVILCDAQGRYRAQWQYFDKPMLHYGQYFKIRYGKGMAKKLIPEVTYILAKQIMPSLGFAWISEDPIILYQWFTALNERDEFFGAYKIELDIDLCIKEDPLELDDIPSEAFVPEETLAAEKYWEWLKEKIKDRNYVSRSGSGIQIVDGDVLLDHDQLITEFGRVFSRFRDAVVIGAQFNHLGLCQLDGQDYRYFQYYTSSGYKGKAGMAGSIFSAAQLQGVESEKNNRRFTKIDRNDARVYFPGIEAMPQSEGLVPSESPGSVETFHRLESSFSIVNLLKNILGR
ncbi:MAG: hypothetical protein VX112_06205 [Pseudomonadota bacterium]|nr:hypothetical protein [Pseudomonadota bacterium]